MAEPLPELDRVQIEAFWVRAIAAGAVPDGTMPDAEPFGDSVELADELIALIVDGPKRATASSYEECLQQGEQVPAIGRLSIATDGAGRARAVLRTADVRIGPLSSVDDAFAWDEGEGDRTRASWLADHETFFRRWLPQLGIEFSSEMPTVFERFDVIYSEPGNLPDRSRI